MSSPRATDADVRALVEMEASVSTTPFITTASVIANEYLNSKGMSETLLTQIEIYLAAHFAVLAVERGGLTKDTIDDTSATYRTIDDSLESFSSTRFGQTAKTLDRSGTLKDIGASTLNALFEVVGLPNANPRS